MNTKELSLNEVLALVRREESHFFDKKAREVPPRKVEKAAVAFANADGGELLIGVADDKEAIDDEKRWDGFDSIEKINSFLQVLFALNPALDLRYELLKLKGQTNYVLKVIIEKGSEVHKTSNGTVYQRLGAQSLPVNSPERIAALAFAKGAASFEDTIIGERLIPLTQVRLYVVGSAVAGIVPFYDVPIARGLVVGCESQQCFE